ncbi:hypothetical protein [Microcoleus sp. CZ3-B4]|uniref:hypothetical protein n=1 Tax=Microcoleus sp. CZ3-B4 TaxID=2818733 RepID=UPI002FD49C24
MVKIPFVGQRHGAVSSIAPPGDGYIQSGAILPVTRNQDTAVPFPYKSRDGYIPIAPAIILP